MKFRLTLLSLMLAACRASAQSADWQSVVWRDPQVRYLLTDMTIGGKTELYRKYAIEEKDPDSLEAIRLYDAGVRVVNTNEFERKWIASQFGKDGRVFRVVQRGSDRTISGREVLLSSDSLLNQGKIRTVLADLSLGGSPAQYESGKSDPSIAEALRMWLAGARVLNIRNFEAHGGAKARAIVYRGTDKHIDGFRVQLNSDLPYPEVNVRYFLADMMLGGSRDFYHRTSETAHEMGCLEAVARFDSSVKVTNLDQFERKKVDGKVLITLKNSLHRISGSEVQLSTDLP